MSASASSITTSSAATSATISPLRSFLASPLARIAALALLGVVGCGESAPPVTPADLAPPSPTPDTPAEAPKAEPAPASKEAPKSFQIERNMLVLPSPVSYSTAGAEPSGSDAALSHVKAFLDARSDVTQLRVEVHTDRTGSRGALQELSDKRALAVAKALVEKGVDCKRLIPVGFGGEKPVADDSTPEGRAQNRRTSFVVATLRGRAIGGMPTDGGGHLAGDPCH